jgi:hypothetical protein
MYVHTTCLCMHLLLPYLTSTTRTTSRVSTMLSFYGLPFVFRRLFRVLPTAALAAIDQNAIYFVFDGVSNTLHTYVLSYSHHMFSKS